MEKNRDVTGRPRRAHSPSRSRVLDLVRRNRTGVALASIVRFTGLHENTVRGHLAALHADGLVTRERGAPDGRGRPPWLWSAAAPAGDGGYAGLANALAAAVTSGSDDAQRLALQAGRSWGRDLVRAGRGEAGPASTPDPIDGVEDLLRRLDYEPGRTDEPGVLHLRSCPLLDVAARHPDVVCTVHHGLVRGALEEDGHGDVPTTLESFALPGACVLRMGAAALGARAEVADPDG